MHCYKSSMFTLRFCSLFLKSKCVFFGWVKSNEEEYCFVFLSCTVSWGVLSKINIIPRLYLNLVYVETLWFSFLLHRSRWGMATFTSILLEPYRSFFFWISDTTWFYYNKRDTSKVMLSYYFHRNRYTKHKWIEQVFCFKITIFPHCRYQLLYIFDMFFI